MVLHQGYLYHLYPFSLSSSVMRRQPPTAKPTLNRRVDDGGEAQNASSYVGPPNAWVILRFACGKILKTGPMVLWGSRICGRGCSTLAASSPTCRVTTNTMVSKPPVNCLQDESYFGFLQNSRKLHLAPICLLHGRAHAPDYSFACNQKSRYSQGFHP